MIVDLSMIVRTEASVICTSDYTYKGFASHVLKTVERTAICRKVTRLDIVSDRYEKASIKGATRVSRGTEGEVIFNESDNLPTNFGKVFLSNNKNKIKFNDLIQRVAANPLFWTFTGEVVITFGNKVWSRNDGPKEIMRFVPEVHEQADNRMIAHLEDMLAERSSQPGKDVIVRTGDTDVVVILIAFYEGFLSRVHDLKLWVEVHCHPYNSTEAR